MAVKRKPRCLWLITWEVELEHELPLIADLIKDRPNRIVCMKRPQLGDDYIKSLLEDLYVCTYNTVDEQWQRYRGADEGLGEQVELVRRLHPGLRSPVDPTKPASFGVGWRIGSDAYLFARKVSSFQQLDPTAAGQKYSWLEPWEDAIWNAMGTDPSEAS